MAKDLSASNDDGKLIPSQLAYPLTRKDNPLSEPDDLPADDASGLDDTHPATDTNIQLEEEYDEGISGAAEANEPNRHDAVIGYDPSKDHRQPKN
jgi:hypothetical protein